MTAINFEQKGLFTFTVNPMIDNGVAVLALIAGKNNFEDITPGEIMNNLELFFEPIKCQFDDSDASGIETSKPAGTIPAKPDNFNQTRVELKPDYRQTTIYILGVYQ